MLKAGDIAIVKTSNEEVFVLKVTNADSDYFPVQLIVRRPVGTADEGIKHVTDVFFLEELESKDERLEREIDERTKLRDRVMKKEPLSVDPDDFGGGPSLN